MVGGWVIEIAAAKEPGVSRIWVVDRENADEMCVHARTEAEMPPLGSEIWWQGGKIMWDRDRRTLEKVGYSHRPRECRRTLTPS